MGVRRRSRSDGGLRQAFPAGYVAIDVRVVDEAVLMETAKDEVRRILDSLPDETTLEDVQYRIYVRQAIDAGLQDISEGRTLSQEEAEQRVARWLEK